MLTAVDDVLEEIGAGENPTAARAQQGRPDLPRAPDRAHPDPPGGRARLRVRRGGGRGAGAADPRGVREGPADRRAADAPTPTAPASPSCTSSRTNSSARTPRTASWSVPACRRRSAARYDRFSHRSTPRARRVRGSGAARDHPPAARRAGARRWPGGHASHARARRLSLPPPQSVVRAPVAGEGQRHDDGQQDHAPADAGQDRVEQGPRRIGGRGRRVAEQGTDPGHDRADRIPGRERLQGGGEATDRDERVGQEGQREEP